jgi:hypothetical protein
MTIAQLVYDNERHYLTDEQINAKVSREYLGAMQAYGFHAAHEDMVGDG